MIQQVLSVTMASDILVEIPHDRLPDLALLYEKRAAWAPYMFTFVRTAIKWKTSDKYKDSVTLLSVGNSWEDDGTVVIFTRMYSQDVYVFTLDDDCTTLYEGLSKTNRIKRDSGRYFFYAIHEKHIFTVKKVIEEKKLNVKTDIPCFLYAAPPEEARKFTLECPSEVFVKKLEPSDGSRINDMWPHRFVDSDKHISSFIDANGGYGIFLSGTNELVAWIIRHVFGNMTMLHTDSRHQRKGYAGLVTKALAKEIGEDGYWSLGTVLIDNERAVAMFEKLGFRVIGKCTFITVE